MAGKNRDRETPGRMRGISGRTKRYSGWRRRTGEEALADVKSGIRLHIETFEQEALEIEEKQHLLKKEEGISYV